jgi:hypothetical protein
MCSYPSSSSSALASRRSGVSNPSGQPAVDRREKSASFGRLAEVTPKPSEAGGGAQFKKPRSLAVGDLNGLEVKFDHLVGRAFSTQQGGFYAIQFRRPGTFAIRLSVTVPGRQMNAGFFQFADTNETLGEVHPMTRGHEH